MFIKCTTKDNRDVTISLENVKEILTKNGSYVRIFYHNGTTTSLTYNPRSFNFDTDYTLDIAEINNVIHEVKLLH